jgi:hypothetical protein
MKSAATPDFVREPIGDLPRPFGILTLRTQESIFLTTVIAQLGLASRLLHVFATADMIIKVKEPQPAEISLLREGQVLFTYLHLAADKAQAAVCFAQVPFASPTKP